MNTATKVGLYLAALGVVFAAAFGVGNAVGPVGPAADHVEQPTPADGGHDPMGTRDENPAG